MMTYTPGELFTRITRAPVEPQLPISQPSQANNALRGLPKTRESSVQVTNHKALDAVCDGSDCVQELCEGSFRTPFCDRVGPGVLPEPDAVAEKMHWPPGLEVGIMGFTSRSSTLSTSPAGSDIMLVMPTLLSSIPVAPHCVSAPKGQSRPRLAGGKPPTAPQSRITQGSAVEPFMPGLVTSAPLPSIGSAGHEQRKCKPCAFINMDRGCQSGADCTFCHLCPPGEKKVRSKDRRKAAWDRRSKRDAASLLHCFVDLG